MSDKESLDSLLRDALKHDLASRRTKKIARKADSLYEQAQESYNNPKNWSRGATISLIHKETGSCLGNFIEFFHTSGARKLLPSSQPPTRSEEVSGPYWLNQKPSRASPEDSGLHSSSNIQSYLKRRATDEVKETLKKLSADDLLKELDDL